MGKQCTEQLCVLAHLLYGCQDNDSRGHAAMELSTACEGGVVLQQT